MSAVTLHVKASTSTSYSLSLPLSSTVQNAKEALERVSGVPPSSQRLIYSGQVMANERTLESYGLLPTLPSPALLTLAPSSPPGSHYLASRH